MKKQASFFLSLFLLGSSSSLVAGALLTKSEEFSKIATYGLNTATYTAEKKDAKEAAAKLLTFDIIWDILGKGEEFFLNGDPNAFPKFKDDILKVKLVVDKVAEVSSKLGAGEYGDALIGLMDGGLGVVNHPVLNAVWEASKLVIESEKQYKSTKAALQIETLYGVVNHDRRIIGTSSGNAPATIPLDSDTVTYFFNKYLITDASTRELVKAYVQTKLGETFPEISVSLWDRMSGSTQAIQEEHELQQLQEFENVSRRWIKALLQDLNKQVEREWAQTRLRQESEKFKVFSEKFGKAFSNVDEVIGYYTKLKTLEKQKTLFPAKLAELKKIKATAESNAKSADFGVKSRARGVLYNLSTESNVFAVNSMVISEYALEKEFTELQIQALALIQQIDKEFQENKEEIVKGLHQAAKEAPPAQQEYEKSLLALFKPSLDVAYDKASEYKEPSFNELKQMLSENNVAKASTFIKEWETKNNALFKEVDTLFYETFNATESSKPSVKEEQQQALDLAWKNAKEKTLNAYGALFNISSQRYGNDSRLLNEMFNHFIAEMKRVSIAVYEQRNALGTFLQKLSGTYGKGYNTSHSLTPDDVIIHWKPQIENAAIGANEYLKEHAYTNIGRINDEGVSLHSVEGIIASRKEEIIAPVSAHISIIQSLSSLEGDLYALEAAKSDWKKFPKLDDQTLALFNDLASKTQEEAKQKVNLMPIYTLEESNGLGQLYGNVNGYKETMRKMDQLVSRIDPASIRSKAQQYLQSVESELNNRQRDYEYLEKLQKEWKEWYAQQLAQELLTLDKESGKMVVSAGMKHSKEGNYAIISDPYLHYATEKELKTNEKLDKAKADLTKLSVYTFIQNSMPNTKVLLSNLFEVKEFNAAPEENFLLHGDVVVWKSDLDKCEKLIGEIDIKKEDAYLSKLKEVAALLPYTISFPPLEEDKKSTYESTYYAKYGKFNDGLTAYSYEHFPLGKKFIELRLRIQELMALKGKLIEQKRLEDSVVESLMLKEVKALHAKVEDLAISETEEYIATYKALSAEYQKHATVLEEAKAKGTGVPDQMLIANLLYHIQQRLASHEDHIRSLSQGAQQLLVQQLYQRFAQEYSAKNLSSLMSLISDEWMSSSDGTTLMDLEATLGNSFSIFNEVTCTIDSLYITQAGPDTYRVNYTVTIQGENYENDIKHLEKSSVSEEVKIINGKAKISQTLSGTYWKTR